MRLSEKRILFSTGIAELVLYINSLGYGVAIDFVKRCEKCPVGRKDSCHKSGLAADLHFYDRKFQYLNGKHPETMVVHSLAHNWWDKHGGAPRISGDLNHYSVFHYGVR